MTTHYPEFKDLPALLAAKTTDAWQTCETALGGWAPPPAVLESLPSVWASSDFVAKTCIASPQLLKDLVESGDLQRPYQPGELMQRLARLQPVSEEDLFKVLRTTRRREALRVAWRDLAAWADLDEVTLTMSELADGCIQLALSRTYQSACEDRGTPRDRHGQAVLLTVLGLGKLGGRELNFSSDIDLIFTYREDGETDGHRPVSNHEFFRRLSPKVISALDKITEDGFVFRVDMRLRPDGKSGPIALSFDATEHYYQVHGRDWERYALIKARPVAGDIDAGQDLLRDLNPFIYRKYLDFGAFQSIRDMKTMIDREVRRKQAAGDVKLGSGGIREIEFVVQSLQLIRGGREPALRSNRISVALKELVEHDAIDKPTADHLRHAYTFLRNLEHRLQMLNDEQTHRLPEQPGARIQVALAMGYESWTDLEREHAKISGIVHHCFQQILNERAQSSEAPDVLTDVWSTRIDDETAEKSLGTAGYEDAGKVFELIKQSRLGKLYQSHSNTGRERLDRLMPQLIHLAGTTESPDETLARLLRFVDAVGRRSAYLILLIENPLALKQLVGLCGASEWISKWLSQYPLLLEELLLPISSGPDLDKLTEEIRKELELRLRSVSIGDMEHYMEAFREIHHAFVLHVAAADILHAAGPETVAGHLCDIAEALLNAIVDYCMLAVKDSIGLPNSGSTDVTPGFGIAAYGKLGSRELGYNSDLDLVFIHHNAPAQEPTLGGERSVSNEQYYGRLAQKILHAITTRTGSGLLYDIDSRLRPSGRSGPLVTSLSAFESYQRDQAWTWEHQALVKARMISGPDELRLGFERVRREVLTRIRDPEQLKSDVADMREKMRSANDKGNDTHFDLKQGKGGLVDIEFLVQYYVLLKAHECPELLNTQSNAELLTKLSSLEILGEERASLLRDIYHCYLTLEHRCKLANQDPVVDAGTLESERFQVSRIWQDVFG